MIEWTKKFGDINRIKEYPLQMHSIIKLCHYTMKYVKNQILIKDTFELLYGIFRFQNFKTNELVTIFEL